MDSKVLHELDILVVRAKEGNREALESLVRAVQRDVYSLAMRFLWHPQDAEDGGEIGSNSMREWVEKALSASIRQRSHSPNKLRKRTRPF